MKRAHATSEPAMGRSSSTRRSRAHTSTSIGGSRRKVVGDIQVIMAEGQRIGNVDPGGGSRRVVGPSPTGAEGTGAANGPAGGDLSYRLARTRGARALISETGLLALEGARSYRARPGPRLSIWLVCCSASVTSSASLRESMAAAFRRPGRRPFPFHAPRGGSRRELAATLAGRAARAGRAPQVH